MTLGRWTPARGDAVLAAAVAAIVVSVLLAVLGSRPPGLDERATSIDRQLRCPTCQGLSIADSPATAATQMRAVVREQLEAGATDGEVRAFFVARYGRWILLDPPATGVDLALWLLPAFVVGLGAAVVVRRARSPEPGPPVPRTPVMRLPAIGRLPTLGIAGGMVLALAVPIAAAVAPRLAGQEVTGRAAPQPARSIADLEALVRARPDDVVALVSLGDALLEAGRPGEAATQYQAALAVDPDHIPALLGAGTILLSADRADAAAPVFDRILRLSPDQPDALLYRAVARWRIDGGVTPEVRADVDRFLAVAEPDDQRRTMAAELLAGSRAPASPAPGIASPRP